jgi:oxygen-dependent protoporphyrinogen oxidase
MSYKIKKRNRMKIGIVGCGVSGLSVLWKLVKTLPEGSTIEIYEKQKNPGGLLQTHSQEGYLIELGPQTIFDRDNSIFDQFKQMKLDHLLTCLNSSSLTKYLLKDTLIALNKKNLLTGQILPLKSLFRIFKEPFVDGVYEDESVKDFFLRRFGSDFYTHLVNALLRGIWGGGGDLLSITECFPTLKELEKKYGSVLKGFLKKKEKTKKGQMLSANLGWEEFCRSWFVSCQKEGQNRRIKIIWHHQAVSLMEKRHQKWHINQKKNYDAIFCCSNPFLIESFKNEIKNYFFKTFLVLENLKYHDFTILAFGGKLQKKLDGFGALCPIDQNFLGVLFCHNINPKHAPQGQGLVKVITGGEITVAKEDLKTLEKKAQIWLAKKGIKMDPKVSMSKTFQNAVSLPTSQLQEIRGRLRDYEKAKKGIYFCGQYETKAGIPDSMKSGFEAVTRSYEFLKKQKNEGVEIYA